MERAIAFELRVHRLSTVIVVRFFFFFLPHFPDSVIRSLLLELHAELVDKNFVQKEPTTCKLLF